MALKDKTDQKIKKYLKSIAEDVKESNIFNSYHYMIDFEGKLRHIRFSDHISTRAKDCFIDIIKVTNESYQVWFNSGDKMICNETNVVEYIKAYYLISERFKQRDESIRDALHKAEFLANKASKSGMQKTIDSLKSENIKLQEEIKDLKEKNKIKQTTIESLNKSLTRFQKIGQRLDALKAIL